ncbi:hypothetical protein KKB18_06015 [bacterium]|nr:hypothetical protein [bacterium]
MWVDFSLKSVNRKYIPITYDPHLIIREGHRNLNLDRVEETVRFGKIDYSRCERPGKICFVRYFGKENMTYCTFNH